MRRRVRVARTRKEEAREHRTYAKPTVAAGQRGATGLRHLRCTVVRRRSKSKTQCLPTVWLQDFATTPFATAPREDTAPVTCCGVG